VKRGYKDAGTWDEWENLTLVHPWIIIALEEMSLIGAA
jgi:hypothetical protein